MGVGGGWKGVSILEGGGGVCREGGMEIGGLAAV